MRFEFSGDTLINDHLQNENKSIGLPGVFGKALLAGALHYNSWIAAPMIGLSLSDRSDVHVLI